MTLSLYATLTAHQGNTLTGVLLPYGQPGRTSAGTVTATQGALALPEDPTSIVINEEHNPLKPLGRFTTLTDTAEGLTFTASLADTQAGRDAAVLAAEGLRTGISVEVDDPIIASGRLIGGRLTGAGLCVAPAFDDARAVTASDTPTPKQKENPMTTDTPATDTTAPVQVTATEQVTDSSPALAATQHPQSAPLFTAADTTADLSSRTLQALQSGGGASTLMAALEDLLPAMDTGKAYIRDQDIGEIWQGFQVDRPLANSIRHRVLTSLTIVGRKKNRGFDVADWAGKKTEIPSSKFTTEQVTTTAKAMAGAVDISMELVEFGSEDVIADLYRQAVESYAAKSEAKVRAGILAGATAGGTATNIFDVVDQGARTLATMGARLDFISVAPDIWSKLIQLETAKAPWWLTNGQGTITLSTSRATTSDVNFTVNADLGTGSVLLGDSRAATLYESKDFRYRALDLPRGGVDISLIKFWALMVEDPRAILKYQVAAPGRAR